MNKKPINNIIPQIHNIQDCWLIQWIGKEYYIKKCILKKLFNLYAIIQYLLLMLICILADVFPINNMENVLKMFLIAMFIGIMNGLSIAEDKEFND